MRRSSRPRAAPRRNLPLLVAGAVTVACLALAAGHGRAWTIPGLDALEQGSLDARFRLRGPRAPADDRIVVVGIDDHTRHEFPDTTQTRRGWARLIEALAAAGPEAIAVDVFFASAEEILPPPLADRVRAAHAGLAAADEPAAAVAEARDVLAAVAEELRGDELLAAAIARAGTVYLGVYFHLAERAEDLPRAPPAEHPGAARARIADSVAAGGPNQPPTAYAVTATRAAIGAGARGAGMVNTGRDADGVTRWLPMVVAHGDRHYLPLGLAVALAAEGRAGDASYVAGRDAIVAGGRTLPLGPGATARLSFLGPNRSFPRVSAAAVLDGTAPREALAGKLVFLGFTHAAYDKVATPFDPLTDGVELHATLAENVLGGGLLRTSGRGATLAAIALVGGLLTLLELRPLRRRAWLPPAIAVVLLVGWAAYAYARFAAGVVVEAVPPLAAGALVAVAGGVTARVSLGRERAHLRAAFSQYVSATLVERILARPELARLGGERRELTVMFSDIRGFSRLAESLEPERLAAFLNEYLTPMTDLVLDADGTLDKYIGDAVMAIWGAPAPVPDHAGRACEVALAMLDRLAPLNVGWRASGLPQVRIGIGLNTGPMAVGNMGSASRFDYTVLGDAVNLAARLEGLTKEYDVDVLVGDETAAAAAGRFVFRELDWVRVKGRGGTAAIHELVGARGAARYGDADLARWSEALAAYRARDFDRAVELWGDLALAQPGDGAARVMRARAEALRAAPPPDDWDGVYEQTSK